MQTLFLKSFKDGWVVGDFVPSIVTTNEIELAIKTFSTGDVESQHYQMTVTEASIVVSGRVRIGNQTLSPGEILIVEPREIADFECLEDAVVVAIKWPSLPSDKVIQV